MWARVLLVLLFMPGSLFVVRNYLLGSKECKPCLVNEKRLMFMNKLALRSHRLAMKRSPPTHAHAVIVGGSVICTSNAYRLAKLRLVDGALRAREQSTYEATWPAAGLITSAGMGSKRRSGQSITSAIIKSRSGKKQTSLCSHC